MDPGGGGWTTSKEGGGGEYIVTMTSALGRTTTWKSAKQALGGTLRTSTAPDGSASITDEDEKGGFTETSADGTTITKTVGPDPRFGMASPVFKEITVTLPSGLSAVVQNTRTATLADEGY